MSGIETVKCEQEKARQGEFYDSYADDYDNVELWSQGGLENRYRKRFMLRRAVAMARRGRLSPDSVTLEVGCGTGNYTRFWGDWSDKTYALDLSPGMLSRAVPKINSHSLAFVRADAESLPFRTSSVDAVLSVNVAEHIEIPVALAEMRRVCRNGARIVLSIPNSNTTAYRLLMRSRRLAGWLLNADAFAAPRHDGEIIHNVPTSEELLGMFGKHGIRPEGRAYMGFVGRGLAQKVRAYRVLELLESLMEKVPVVKTWAGVVIIWGSVAKEEA